MSTTYDYNVSAVDFDSLEDEIGVAGLPETEGGSYIPDELPDNLHITFAAPLSAPDKTTLDAVVAAHTGIPVPTPLTKSGSLDIDSSVGAVMWNIAAIGSILEIKKVRFWISANGVDVGANVKQPIKLEFFSKDTGENCEDGTDFQNGRLAVVPEFQFASQDVKVAVVATDGAVDIDDTADFNAGDLVRIHDGTEYEYQRVGAITDTDTLDIVDTAQNAWALDNDVSRVLELADIEYTDEDETDEIHLKVTPGDAVGDDVRLHYVMQVELKK